MAKTKQQKEQIVADLSEKLQGAKSVTFVNYSGLSVEDTNEVKQKSREQNTKYLALKKTLLKLALKNLGVANFDEQQTIFDGEIAGFFNNDDEVTAPKIAAQLAKKNEHLKIKGGIMDQKIIDANLVKQLVAIPGKDQLYANLVGSLNAPISGFVGVLKGNLRALAQVLGAIRDQKAQ